MKIIYVVCALIYDKNHRIYASQRGYGANASVKTVYTAAIIATFANVFVFIDFISLF